MRRSMIIPEVRGNNSLSHRRFMTPTSSELGPISPLFPSSRFFSRILRKSARCFSRLLVFLFCRKIKLQTFSHRADSQTQFYFIISLADRQQQEGIHDLLLDRSVCDRASPGSAKKCEHTESWVDSECQQQVARPQMAGSRVGISRRQPAAAGRAPYPGGAIAGPPAKPGMGWRDGAASDDDGEHQAQQRADSGKSPGSGAH